MTASVIIASYLGGCYALLALIVWRDVHDLREAFWLSVFWPLSLLFIAVGILLLWTPELWGWKADIVDRREGQKPWGWRRPVDGWPGIAVWCPLFELQYWKARK